MPLLNLLLLNLLFVQLTPVGLDVLSLVVDLECGVPLDLQGQERAEERADSREKRDEQAPCTQTP